MSPNRFDQEQLKEKVDVLYGSRQSDQRNAAVRIADLAQLLQITELKTKTLSAAPSMDDFNSLLADVKLISNQLQAVAKALQARIIK